jgi:hypothetical protein
MARRQVFAGDARWESRTPNWGPLESLLGSDLLCGYFMWMGDIELEDGTILDAYKHHVTRDYLHLASDGRAFRYTPAGRYREVDVCTLIGEVFADWECCEPTDEERAALSAVLRKAPLATD